MSTAIQGSGTPFRILIAEDSPTQAQQLAHILEGQGYAVEMAANGRIALEMAQRSPPALVISDVVMPEMDGYELARRIKSDPSLRHLPVMIVTTLSDPEDVIRGIQCGADSFILKPYEERHLLKRAQYLLFNRDTTAARQPGIPVEIFINARKHSVSAEPVQILNLLLSTYEGAIERNKDLQRSEEALQEVNSRLEKANNELQWFCYAVSHDLRAPLRHIAGYTELLLREVEGQLSGEARRYLDVITHTSGHMGQLIDDLLQFSQVDRAEMRRVAVDLNAIVREAISGLEMDAAGRRIEWDVSLLPSVAGDAAMLRQVFCNLLGNAVKYTRQRDPAQIEVGCLRAENGNGTFYVRDNGAGFDMKYADKLFGVFQRLHSAEDFEGTGIGLAIVRRIVARHGGHTWAEGERGKGATFYFSLPIDGLAEAASSPPGDETPQ
jgi:signal transduction histidine kinase